MGGHSGAVIDSDEAAVRRKQTSSHGGSPAGDAAGGLVDALPADALGEALGAVPAAQDPISHETLHQLWPTHLPAGSPDTDDGFDTGVVWALRPVAATIALLQRAGSYEAYDYVIRLVRDNPSG